MILQKRIPQQVRHWPSSRRWFWGRRCFGLAGCRAALATAFQPLLCQFRQGVVGLAGQHLFVIASRQLGVFLAIQLDVAEQQRHEGAPAQHRSLSVRILRLVHQLLQQPAGKAVSFGVVALAVSPLRILIVLLEIAVHALEAVDPVVSPVSRRGVRRCPRRCAVLGPQGRSRRARPAGLPHRPAPTRRSWCGSRWWRSGRC